MNELGFNSLRIRLVSREPKIFEVMTQAGSVCRIIDVVHYDLATATLNRTMEILWRKKHPLFRSHVSVFSLAGRVYELGLGASGLVDGVAPLSR